MTNYNGQGHAYSLSTARPYVTKRLTYGSSSVSHKTNRTLANTIFLTLIVSLLVFMLFMVISLVVDSKEQVELIEVTVTSGDTLWTLAKNHFHANGDIREFIYTIQKLNKLTSARIYPGQVILIPLID